MRKAAALAFGLVALLALSGCASAPAIKSPEECLVIAKVITHNPDKVARARNYFLEFETGHRPQVITIDYVVIKTKGPGTRLAGIFSGVKEGYRGERYGQDMKVELPYEPGATLIAPFLFVRRITKVDEDTTRTSIAWRMAEPSERFEFGEYLRTKPAFAELLSPEYIATLKGAPLAQPRNPGTLTVKALVQGVVLVDGEVRGTVTPGYTLSIEGLEAGPHRVEFRNELGELQRADVVIAGRGSSELSF